LIKKDSKDIFKDPFTPITITTNIMINILASTLLDDIIHLL